VSARRRRELRWIFAVIFAAGAAAPLAARQVSFAAQQAISTSVQFATSVFTADLDGDGDLDVLSASSLDGEIAWYENADGAGGFGSQQVISTLAGGASSVFAADVDGDGDLDVLSASSNDRIAWYENTDGSGGFGSQQVISALADAASSVFAADVDGDGDIDVLSASTGDDKIAWYENTDGSGSFGSERVFSTLADAAYAVFAADVDGDGDLDALSASYSDGKIAWYENFGGGFGSQLVITTLADGASSVFAADVDGDGDLDVLSASLNDAKIAWYENTNGAGGFGSQRIISTLADLARSVFAADVDGDGDLDALSAHDDEISWYENLGPDDGSGPCGEVLGACFGAAQVISTLVARARTVVAVDVDGDGDLDVLSASFNDHRVAWYENQTLHRSAVFPVQQVITSLAGGARSVYAADVDGDGDLDVLSTSRVDDEIAWYANTDGSGSFGSEQVIASLADGASSVVAADVDGDGDLDVLSALFDDDTIAWYANTDGSGSFGSEQVISTQAYGALSAFAADVDGDGALDVLSASFDGDAIAWYENTDGSGSFGSEQVISSLADGAASVFAADLDGDGDLDVLSASFYGDAIAWYENTDGSGSFGSEQVIDSLADGAGSVFAADMDGDGDLDVLSASVDGGRITWYENTDGSGSFGSEQVISTLAGGASSVLAADVDGDGDLDVLSASVDGDTIAWYENTDGSGSFGSEQVVSTLADGASSVFAADVDGDGDLDVLSASFYDDEIAWYENRGGQFSLTTTDVAQRLVSNQAIHDLLRVVVTHEGRAGDSPVELASLELGFTDGAGAPLDETELGGLIQTLRLYLDDGEAGDVFDPGDALVASTTDFSSIDGAGVLTWTLADDDSNLQVTHGSPRTYFLAAEMTADAESQAPGAFDVEHRTETSSEGQEATADIPLLLEFAGNVGTAKVDTALSTASCQAPFDLTLEDRTVSATVTCEAGTVLTAGSSLTVVTPGALTLRAGQSIELVNEVAVEGGTLTVEVDPGLDP
jgi:hypothetical protein